MQTTEERNIEMLSRRAVKAEARAFQTQQEALRLQGMVTNRDGVILGLLELLSAISTQIQGHQKDPSPDCAMFVNNLVKTLSLPK